jgi:hypothetical protein
VILKFEKDLGFERFSRRRIRAFFHILSYSSSSGDTAPLQKVMVYILVVKEGASGEKKSGRAACEIFTIYT